MRDHTESGGATTQRNGPKGLAFEIADHWLVSSWAAFHDFRISVRLDHAVEDEEYEEVIEIHTGPSRLSGWIMWRSSASVCVQPLVGKNQCFTSVAEALASLFVMPHAMVTDIVPTSWPSA